MGYRSNYHSHWRCGLEGLELAHFLIDTILEKKGNDLLLLDITDQAIFTDYFLLCNGDNRRQLDALAESIMFEAKQRAESPAWSSEGDADSGWILIDFGGVIVHVFSPEMRHYYNLEELWKEGRVLLRMP